MALAFPIVLALVAVATLLIPSPAVPAGQEVRAATSLEAVTQRDPTPMARQASSLEEPRTPADDAPTDPLDSDETGSPRETPPSDESQAPSPDEGTAPGPALTPEVDANAPHAAASPPLYFLPVEGVRVADVPDTFGDPRGTDRSHLGVDILADRGTPIRAAAPGEVWRANESAISVTVIGDDGVRYFYTHLDSIAPGIERGSRVGTDTVIGFVGNTGNAAATAPHLHFEVALPVPGQRYSWEPIDPLKYMLDR